MLFPIRTHGPFAEADLAEERGKAGGDADRVQAGAEEVTVAIFRVSEVTGVFTGGLEPARASA